MDAVHEKQHIEIAIGRARDGVGQSIDELDRQLRRSLDFKTAAADHAPQLLAGGAMVGFLVGFGFPKVLKRVVQIAVPIALVAYKVKKVRDGRASSGTR